VKDALHAALGPRLRVPITVLSILIGAFLLFPIGIVISTSFTAGFFLTFPPEGFSTRWYSAILDNPEWTKPFWTSIRVALFATTLATVVGTCAALGMRRAVRGRRSLSAIMVAPVTLPLLAYALGLYDLFNRWPIFEGTNVPVVLGQAVVAFPLVYVIVLAGLAAVDRRVTDAASTLGARWPMIVWKIELPLIRNNIIVAALFAFTISFDEAVIALIMSPPESMTLPVQMFRAARESISPELAAASTIVMALAVVVLALGAVIERHGLKRGTAR
jgi:putative spermidine/putrescine transport system permease protein